MRYSAALAAVALASFASAQNNSNIILVGTDGTTGGLVFTPPTVKASNGTVVTFEFRGAPGNHSVTQSTFKDPCTQLQGGFSSGYIQVPPGTTEGFPTWNLTVTDDSKPIWFYCASTAGGASHCLAGMVGGINVPDSGNNFQAFQSSARAVPSFTGSATAPALTGPGASASAAPGPFSGSITGFAVPTAGGSAPAPSGGSASGSGSGTAAPAPSGTGTGNGNGAMSIAVNGAAVVLSLVAGAALL